MSITRRNFIKLSALAGVFAGTNLLAPRFAAARHKASNGVGEIPANVLNDPLYSLKAADFRNCVGSEFTLSNALDGSNAAAVLSKVTTVKKPSKKRGIENGTRGGSAAENFTLTFSVPAAGDFPQATYTLLHPVLGQFDLLLVPGETSSGERLLHAVINRV